MEVYAWGSGNYGRLGLGHSNDARIPQRVAGVLNGCDVTATACGWYHSGVVTSTGDVAAFGSKVTRCLGLVGGSGSEASDDDSAKGAAGTYSEDSFSGSEEESKEGLRRRGGALLGAQRHVSSAAVHSAKRDPRGRGGYLGGGDHTGSSTKGFVPQVLRSFPSRVTIIQVSVGGDMLGAHTLAVSRNGRLYSWGYGPSCGLGTVSNIKTPTLITKFLGTGVGEASSGRGKMNEMEPLGWGKHSHMRYRRKTPTRQLGLQVLKPRIVKACCGGGFSVVISSEGEVFTFGLSAGGRLGFRTKFRAQLRPRRIETLKEGTTDAATGAGFVLLCSSAGRLIAWGDNSKGQLGIGHLQESFEPLVLGRACPAAFVMQAVAAGDSHALALDSAGRAYSWGGEGGPMTGQGEPLPNNLQVDLAFKFRLRQLPYWWVRPRPIKALASMRIVHIDAGCLHSVALSADGALFAWGAVLQAGASTLGQRPGGERPEVSWVPRLLAPSPKLPLVRVGTVSAGGWHSLATATPCCPAERMLPMDGDASHHRARAFCDGYLVSEPDSAFGVEAQVPLCCAVLRARFAMPDGSDSTTWKALAAQIQWLPTTQPAASSSEKVVLRKPVVEGLSESSDEEEDGEDLMAIVAMHRKRPGPAPASARQRPAQASARSLQAAPASADEAAGKARPSAADEAAGKALHATAEKAPLKMVKAAPKKKAAPVFSSDSSSDGQAAAPVVQPRRVVSAREHSLREAPQLMSARQRRAFSARGAADAPMPPQRNTPSSGSRQAPRKPVVVFSSDSSSDGHGKFNSKAASAAASREQLHLDLRKFSEAVLLAVVRFLHADSLEPLEVIDETHALWMHEQRGRLRPLGPQPGEVDVDADDRPSHHRALKGFLLRREVADLRQIAAALGLERLARSCDQLLLRVDAPGAPALFVPDSNLRVTMGALFQQTLEGPSSAGPDTRLLCSRPGTGRRRSQRRWGLREEAMPANGRLWAHAFMLCTGCEWIRLEQQAEAAMPGSARDARGSSELDGAVCLRRVRSRDVAMLFELDLRDYSVEVVCAWLRYLYTQDDLTLVWPCGGRSASPEEAAEAESFWLELLRLGKRVGDEKFQLYAQDTLIGALSATNWTQFAAFAEQAQCHILSEAALTMGMRILSPAMMLSFKVKTGLEDLDKGSKKDEAEEEPESTTASSSSTPQAATFNRAMPGRPGAARGVVDLEIERHLFEHRASQRLVEPMVLTALKRGSPAQFAELKQRLADGVLNAQQAGAQLQKCAQFFDSQEKKGFKRESGRRLWLELLGLMALVAFFLTPVLYQTTFFDCVLAVVKPFYSLLPSMPVIPGISAYSPYGWETLRVMAVNGMMMFLLLAIIWHGLAN